MEKPKHQKSNSYLLFDCGSSLYDSFELKSFERQLDSAISSRTLSMPHLSDRKFLPPPPATTQQAVKKSSKISRSVLKFLRSVLRAKQFFRVQERSDDRFYFFYDKSGALTTIPELPESGGDYGGSLSPDFKSLARRTASDRFSATAVGISCA